MAGQTLDQIMFWVPQSGDIGIGVSILSYNQKVQFGLIADQRFIPDPENVTPLFASEFETLVTGVLLHDWLEPLDASDFETRLEREINGGPWRTELPAQPTAAVAAAPASVKRAKAAKSPKAAQAPQAVTPAQSVKPAKTASAPPVANAGVDPAPSAIAVTRVPKRFRGL